MRSDATIFVVEAVAGSQNATCLLSVAKGSVNYCCARGTGRWHCESQMLGRECEGETATSKVELIQRSSRDLQGLGDKVGLA